jgi:hypothetical protein
VASRQERHQNPIDHFRLADDGLGNLAANFCHLRCEKFSLLAEGLFALLTFCAD